MDGGLTNEKPQTNHVIRGPMRGLGKSCMGRRQHADTTTDIATSTGEKNFIIVLKMENTFLSKYLLYV